MTTGMRHVAAKLVPRLLTDDQKCCHSASADLLAATDALFHLFSHFQNDLTSISSKSSLDDQDHMTKKSIRRPGEINNLLWVLSMISDELGESYAVT